MVNHNLRSLWEQRLAEQSASGKSISSWCREHSIRRSQFYYWRKKLLADQTYNRQKVKWLPLETKQAEATSSITVHIGQAKVEVKEGFEPQLLRQIVKVLQTI